MRRSPRTGADRRSARETRPGSPWRSEGSGTIRSSGRNGRGTHGMPSRRRTATRGPCPSSTRCSIGWPAAREEAATLRFRPADRRRRLPVTQGTLARLALTCGFRSVRTSREPPIATTVRTIERTSEPPKLRLGQRVRELWSFREVLLNLVRKELKVKYTGSVLGAIWSPLNPLVFLGVFYF